jgi:hypothetical protein
VSTDEQAHDVLAAEEFGVPAPVPGLKPEPAHDVLAAEEFAVPAPPPLLHRGAVQLPDDPSGIAEPHDVLAAEEFAVPAGRLGSAEPPGRHGRARVAATAGTLITLAVLLRRRHK